MSSKNCICLITFFQTACDYIWLVLLIICVAVVVIFAIEKKQQRFVVDRHRHVFPCLCACGLVFVFIIIISCVESGKFNSATISSPFVLFRFQNNNRKTAAAVATEILLRSVHSINDSVNKRSVGSEDNN